ncbi:tudor domain-containing protein 10 [Perognathus longimembris pacificus]|uniref:tudor domain-containing protein 10 n=1 Tax=Perognathus longimembris pacificus TaxID=214514 RepID=UPI002019E7E7|nr:tudor domain-containing protein 10 [Perognathus longimembris pacificus]
MAWNSRDFPPSAKLLGKNEVLEEQQFPGCKKRETQVYVGNLPLDVSEEEILSLLKDYNALQVCRIQNGCKCFAFVDLGSMENVALAIQELNGKLFHGRKLFVNTNKRAHRRTPNVAQGPRELQALETSFGGETAACTQLTPTESFDPCEREKLREALTVPVEMRGSFLTLLLKECYQDLSWLALIPSVQGKVGLLVTNTVPYTPFFWAMNITEALHQNMQMLFSTLADIEEQQPFLRESAVHRGTRCLAEHHLGDHGSAWNRCWVVDRVDSWAVGMFIDFGQLATIPVQSLRSLDSDDFWTIPPLAQPFMLEKDIFPLHLGVYQILKGKITGALNSEVHILKFEELK